MGRLLRTRGRVGEFIAEIDSNQPGRAERLQRVLLHKAEQQGEFEVANLWYHAGRPIFQFAGIDSISAAEPWEGAEILVSADERVRPEPGEYLHEDLIGCVVEQRAVVLGTVEAIEEFGGPPTLRIKTPKGRELLIPFVRALCPEINVAAKRSVVDLPDGLNDLSL